jgi:hypothetical protein
VTLQDLCGVALIALGLVGLAVQQSCDGPTLETITRLASGAVRLGLTLAGEALVFQVGLTLIVIGLLLHEREQHDAH